MKTNYSYCLRICSAFLALCIVYVCAFVPSMAITSTAESSSDVDINAENFPDEFFRNYVKNFDTDENGTLSESERKAVTEMYCGDRELFSVAGIEYFSEIVIFSCDDSGLTTLDLSKNTKLEIISCGVNKLTKLDISGCTELVSLTCYVNELTTLNLKNNTKLKSLSCFSNKLTQLDVSNCPELDFIYCHENRLTYLDLSNQPLLTTLACYDNNITNITLVDGLTFELQDLEGSDYDNPGPICMRNGACVFVDENNCFDTGRLHGGFDLSKVIDYSGAEIDENGKVTFDEFGGTMTYTYRLNTEHTATFTLTAAYRITDLTGDGKTSPLDASLLLRFDAGLYAFTDEQYAKADVNGDGNISPLDASMLLMYDAKLMP